MTIGLSAYDNTSRGVFDFDELEIFVRALTAAEVTGLATQPKCGAS